MITFQSLLTRLILICILPLALLALILAAIQIRSIHHEVDLASRSLASNTAVSADQYLAARIGGLQALAASPLADSRARWIDFYNEAEGYQQSFGSHVIFADRDLHMLFNTRLPFGATLPSLPHVDGRAASQIALKTGRPAVGDDFPGPLAKEPLIAISVPVLRDNKVSALLLTTIETRCLQAQLDRIAKPADWSIALLNSRGTDIARSGPALASRLIADSGSAMRYTANSRLSAWHVVVEIPYDVYWGPVNFAIAALAVSIISAILLGMLGGKLTGRRLAVSVASLAVSSTPKNDAADIAEIAVVRQRLDQEAQYHNMAESELGKFKNIVESSDDAIISKTLQGTITSWNHGAEIMFGYTAAEAIGNSLTMLIPPERLAEEAAILGCIARGEKVLHFETVRRCRDGRSINISASISPILDSAGNPAGVSKIARDITERKLAEAEILSGKTKLEAALASMSDAVFISDLQGRFLHFNHAFATFHKFRNKEECATHLNDYPAFLEVYSTDAGLLPLDEWVVSRALRGESETSAEFTLRRKDTGATWTGSYTYAPIRSERGHIVGSVVTARDVTERKQAREQLIRLNNELEERVNSRTRDLVEINLTLKKTNIELERAQSELIRREKMASLGALVAGVSHEMNTPLGNSLTVGSSLQAEMIQFEIEVDNGKITKKRFKEFNRQLRGGIDLLVRNLEKAIEQITRFRQVSVDQASEQRRRFDLKTIVEDNVSMLMPQFNHTPHKIVVDVPQDIMMDSYPGPVGQVITNLVVNSLVHGFSDDMQGVITIAVAVQDANRLQLTVTDNGCGIPKNNLTRVFDPFFTTRMGQGGNGLGLNIVFNIVTLTLGGMITVDSRVGGNTIFTVNIPMTAC